MISCFCICTTYLFVYNIDSDVNNLIEIWIFNLISSLIFDRGSILVRKSICRYA